MRIYKHDFEVIINEIVVQSLLNILVTASRKKHSSGLH